MDDRQIETIEVNSPTGSHDRDEWVEKHVLQFQYIFKKWQKPIGIDEQAYREHLEKELAAYWQDPLLKSLIETI